MIIASAPFKPPHCITMWNHLGTNGACHNSQTHMCNRSQRLLSTRPPLYVINMDDFRLEIANIQKNTYNKVYHLSISLTILIFFVWFFFSWCFKEWCEDAKTNIETSFSLYNYRSGFIPSLPYKKGGRKEHKQERKKEKKERNEWHWQWQISSGLWIKMSRTPLLHLQ